MSRTRPRRCARRAAASCTRTARRDPSDFLEWFGAGPLNAADARALFESLELEEVDVEGRRAYVLAGDTSFPAAEQSVRLLPEYDVYVMGFRERDVLVPAAGARAGR